MSPSERLSPLSERLSPLLKRLLPLLERLSPLLERLSPPLEKAFSSPLFFVFYIKAPPIRPCLCRMVINDKKIVVNALEYQSHSRVSENKDLLDSIRMEVSS